MDNTVMDFFLKQHAKEIAKENYLMLVCKDGKRYVIEERMLYFMFARQMMPEQLVSLEFGMKSDENSGRYKLSNKGELAYFSTFGTEVENYKKAYECVSAYQVNRRLVNETANILNFYQRNKIESITECVEDENGDGGKHYRR